MSYDKDVTVSFARSFALALVAALLASASAGASAAPTPKPAVPGKGFRLTIVFPETFGPKGNVELFDDSGGCQQVRALIQRPGNPDVITASGTGNGGSPIYINTTGPNGSATATQCNVIVDASIQTGFYNLQLTNIQSQLGFKMAPKIYAPGLPGAPPQVFVGPGNYGLLYVYYGVVK